MSWSCAGWVALCATGPARRECTGNTSGCDREGHTANSSLMDMCCWGGGGPRGLRPQPSPPALTSFCRPHGLQVPKLKAELTHSSLEEGSGHHRRCNPFRVRFADETVWDTAFRYWERSRARKQTGQGAPNSRKFQPAPGRAHPVALGAGSEAPACKGQKAAEPGEDTPELASPEDVRVTSKDEVEGPRSGRSVPKHVAAGNSHSIGPGNHGCPDLATTEGLLAPRVPIGHIYPPWNQRPQSPNHIWFPLGAAGVDDGGKHLLLVFVKAELDEEVSRKVQKIGDDRHHRVWQRS